MDSTTVIGSKDPTFQLGSKLQSFNHYLPGLLLVGAITALSVWAGNIPWVADLGLGALTLAIAVGIVAGNTLYRPVAPQCAAGVHFSKQTLLRLGIILYGFRLTFQQIADVGTAGIVIDLLTLSSTFLMAFWVGRKVFRLDDQTVMLIGAGSSICGAAAVMATEPVVKGDASKVAVAVSTVVIFGTIAIFLYPWLYQLNLTHQWLATTPQRYGVYIGSTVQEVAQVVAAGRAISDDAGNAAVIAKMIRVMMLAPFLLLLANYLARRGNKAGRSNQATAKQDKAPITIPWFAIIFIAVAAFNSLHLLPQAVVGQLITLDTVLLSMAMAALGLTTHISAIRQAGVKPILLATVLFGWMLLGGAAINHLVNGLLL
ncbi:UPF0324 membrane protein [Chitiniphilus shinanonensis]|uniref:UPF0324 membrane protein n=1 Tax=Chitiniphilus shinanonensis TaxID=553088 RepID=A0ABQ6BN12_9NEIS|nr:YeiH family protein [Chitiniphilus shinanonensis]GLS03044.1 UPF0324 membrane protein [Chitiniphilus shinanonensis]